jgi:hypothetical protein
MPIHSVSLAPDAVIEYSDRDDLPVLSTYCGDPDCSPKNLCDQCELAAEPVCEICANGPSMAVLRAAGMPNLAACFDCVLIDLAERAVSR